MTQDSAHSSPPSTPAHTFTSERPLRAAVIGSGPSGIFSAEALIKQEGVPVQVDIIDRLPTPFGLVRYGVAPDHLGIKAVTKTFHKVLDDERVRFLGNVELGRDLSREALLRHYDAVIYAVGASSDRRLGIAGEDLRGSLSATEFVAWYNGHPDAADREINLSAEGVAVIGLGNVALDVSRILAKTAGELQSSDIAAHALERLRDSKVRDIYILGRRGPAQAKFTTKELREFGTLEAAGVDVRAEDMKVDSAELEGASNVVRKNLDVLQGFLEQANTPENQAKPRRVHFRFMVSPAEIVGDSAGNVQAIRIEKNRLEGGRPVGTGEFEELPVGMVLRSVGYRGVPLEGVAFDERSGTIAHEGGRVQGGQAEYAAGWIKRGPSGVIGDNRKCANDTVATLLHDVAAGTLTPRAQAPARADIDAALAAAGADVYTYADWQALDAYEQEAGAAMGRPRHKVVRVEEMLQQRSQG